MFRFRKKKRDRDGSETPEAPEGAAPSGQDESSDDDAAAESATADAGGDVPASRSPGEGGAAPPDAHAGGETPAAVAAAGEPAPPGGGAGGDDDDRTGGKRKGFFSRMREKLNRGDSWLTYDLTNLLPGRKIDDELLEALETNMLMADVGIEVTERIMSGLHKRVERKELDDEDALRRALRDEIAAVLAPCTAPLEIPASPRPFLILMVGVNGAGKTTTAGKLARRFTAEGLKVMMAAGDTFRAAAVDQLRVWGERNDIDVIAQTDGADPAAVVYDAMQAASARGIDVLIADTAGRLHTQGGLMDELAKVKRVIQRIDATAPHEVMLVIDGGMGQNAVAQADAFHKALGVTGITVTKLDGTAKGGTILAIAGRLGLPIRFIGVGESIEDLGPFDAEQFADALLADGSHEPRA
jgi:fused signal recognition particle receptor